MRRLIGGVAVLAAAGFALVAIFVNPVWTVMVILVLVFAAREANRKRIGAPAALGVPYIRGERGL